ncbi:MAG: aminopeptidase P family protein [Bacteroidales bacterium]|nr:aminopeptidase P family protein [Bacteroidales bacterium]
MFTPETYTNRRNALRKEMKSGLILMPGNTEAAYNYPANTYGFRQDSNFSYFFGLDHPDFFGVMDIDNGVDYIFGNDVDMDDIIWMGHQPSVSQQAEGCGVKNTAPSSELSEFIGNAIRNKRTLHFVPSYRGETILLLSHLLGLNPLRLKDYVSKELIKGIVKLRSVKSEAEVAEIEKAVDVAYIMFTTGMKMAKAGVKEQEIVGAMEGISIAHGRPVSFPIILSINGQILHNHHHGNFLKEGRMLVMDGGSESSLLYASDITRTVPVGGKFSQRQKEIYEIVLNANLKSIAATAPGTLYRDCHYVACETIASGLKDLGLMKGDVKQAVAAGAHALFLPHGLGHMLGMDVHDMEGLGQINVGYDEEIQPSDQFGTAYLRMGRRLQPGFVVTNEPGIYFIPELIDLWKSEKKFTEFINYDKVDEYRDFGGIRIEDDILVTEHGCRVLGKPIPKTVADVETTMGM